MSETKIIMGMPITINIADKVSSKYLKSCFDYFESVDKRFSPYKAGSEVSMINKKIANLKLSQEMKEVLKLAEATKQQTEGYFDIEHNGQIDPSGLVKGWAINNAASLLLNAGIKNFCIEAGGDIQVHGKSNDGPWLIGIKNPFNQQEIVKTIKLNNQGVATSGTYIRGQHIYNPHNPKDKLTIVKSLTVIAKNIFEADRFATAAYAMGVKGIEFINKTFGLEGYMITEDGLATYTNGFERYVINA